MPKTNYSFEKRQRDLAKKAKREEKRRRKLESKATETPSITAESAPQNASE
jgi:hypothetical protein